jgi:hypothetical protein
MTNAKQNPPKRHHFVPKFLLQNWATADEKIVVYRRLTSGKVVHDRVAAKGAGYEEHLYSFPQLGENVAVVETKLWGPQDDKASKLVAKMMASGGDELTEEEMVAWSHFLLGMLLRNPESTKSLKEVAQAVWASSGPKTQAQYEALKGPDDPATLEEWLAADDPAGGEVLGVKLFNTLTLNDNVCAFIRAMSWNVLSFHNTPGKLITSDRAIFASNGLAKPTGQIILPLGPEHVFCAFNDQSFLAKVQQEDASYLHDLVRKLMAVRARRYIYAATGKEHDFVAKWLGYEQVPSLGESLSKKWLADPDLAKLAEMLG